MERSPQPLTKLLVAISMNRGGLGVDRVRGCVPIRLCRPTKCYRLVGTLVFGSIVKKRPAKTITRSNMRVACHRLPPTYALVSCGPDLAAPHPPQKRKGRIGSAGRIFMVVKCPRPVYCALSAHVKEPYTSGQNFRIPSLRRSSISCPHGH